ncbi:hypothetical protein KSP40_PGU010985 [Platanthera guangdongensis]|uniref:PB1 domain-containing protein n=1 Tax=Platanthera guangdongensis TaxID=2320717 RepID=A0ABR2M3W6_9ASPA
MAVRSTSSSSSTDSFSSFDGVPANICRTVKFLCSYGGRILPRYPDGRLRYVGGDTRVFAGDRSLSFSVLQVKLRNLCGWESVNLRCQLPTEDLDALVSITSDEDLANLIEECDLARRDQRCPIKIRAFLHQSAAKPPKSAPLPQIPISRMAPRAKASFRHPAIHTAAIVQCFHQSALPPKYSPRVPISGDTSRFYRYPAVSCHAAARHCLLPHRKNFQ